jgi:hypothetical protein
MVKLRAARRRAKAKKKDKARRIYPHDPWAHKLADNLRFRSHRYWDGDLRYWEGPTTQERRHAIEDEPFSEGGP